MSDERHEVIASDDVDGWTVWTAYVPEVIRFVDPRPYATVVFDEDSKTVNEGFTDTRNDAYAMHADRVQETKDGVLEIMQLEQEIKLTDEQKVAYRTYQVKLLSEQIAADMLAGGAPRDPATGHHPECDGDCGGSGEPDAGYGDDLPGQYL